MDAKPHPGVTTNPAATATPDATRASPHRLSSLPSSPPSTKSLDKLAAEIIGLAQHISASEHELLVLQREFDRRQK